MPIQELLYKNLFAIILIYPFQWEKENISFTKENIEDWNESNTVKYNNLSIGEFQVHKNRNCYKFRFNLTNLVKIMEAQNI